MDELGGGTPLSFKQKKVQIINIESNIEYTFLREKDYNFNVKSGLGLRKWFRGKGEYAYSYDELYSWYYYNIGINSKYNFNDNLSLGLNLDYKKSFSGELKTGLGVNFNLDEVDGFTLSVPVEYNLTQNISFIFETKLEKWFIEKSEYKKLGTYTIYEPESETFNKSLSLGLKFYF